MSASRPAALLLSLALLLTGCASEGGADSTSSPAGSAAAASPSAATTSIDPNGPDAIQDRCGVPKAKATPIRLKSGNNTVFGATVGSGPNVAVLLHQTDQDGLCGFWRWMVPAQKTGIRLIAIDMCGNGGSDCKGTRFSEDPIAQTRLAVDWARRKGAKTVTLVGASMGGTIAAGAAAAVKADRMVDLSGPVSWAGVPSTPKALSRLKIPTVVVASVGDPSTDPKALKAAVRKSPAQKKAYVAGPDGLHGVTLLTKLPEETEMSPIGRAVAMFIRSGKMPPS